jgi:putative MATE family efflux protein
MTTSQTKDLEFMPIGQLLLRFSIPAITGTVVNALYNVVDRIFLGHYVGEMGIAATTITMPMMMIIMAVGMLIGFGTNSQISIRLGEKRQEEAERLLGQGWFLFVFTSLALTVLTIWKMDELLVLFGASEQVLPYARAYATIVMIGNLPHEISFGANSFIRGEGNPRFAMITMIIGGVINVILDYIFIVLMGWGMEGAAWATVIGYSISALWVFSYYYRGRSVVKLRLKHFKLHPSLIYGVIMMGSPNFIMNLVASVQASIFNNQLLKYGGDTAVSAMGVIMSFNFFWMMPVIGMSQGMQPVIGYNYGAKKFDRVKRTLYISFAAVTIMCTALFVLVQIYPEYVFKLFIGDRESQIMTMGPKAIQDVFIVLPIVGYLIICSNYFQYTGRPMVSLSLTLLRQVGFLIPALLILPNYIGIMGVWYALPLSDLGTLFITVYLYIKELAIMRIQIADQRLREKALAASS